VTGNTLTCKEFVEIVTGYLEGVLAPEEKARFEAHLAECDGCEIYLDQMEQTIHLLGTLTEDQVPKDATDKMLQVFRDWKASKIF
jgi:anti-sigma factor RsiW